MYSIVTGAALTANIKLAALLAALLKPPVVTWPHSQPVRSVDALTEACRHAGLLVAEVSVNSMCELGQARALAMLAGLLWHCLQQKTVATRALL